MLRIDPAATADALFLKRYILTVDVGFGAISGGTLTDRDFFEPPILGVSLFSESVSTADDDDLFYVNVHGVSGILETCVPWARHTGWYKEKSRCPP